MAKKLELSGSVFEQARKGQLMRLEEHELTRYVFEIWFPYTRQAMNEIRVGTMLAVRNFATDNSTSRYSVMEITQVRPMHYAIGEHPSGFPPFVMDAARSAAADWLEQEKDPSEDTTLILCTAIPVNIEMVMKDDGCYLEDESSIPMLGEEALVLSPRATEACINRDIDLAREVCFEVGTLVRSSGVKAFLRVEDLVRLHFGIFGFTGAGKSNLVSTLVHNILEKSKEPIKVVLFDLMSEYPALLIDELLNCRQSAVICVGEKTLPGPVFAYVNHADRNSGDVARAADSFLHYTLLPKPLKPQETHLKRAYQRLLLEDKIKVVSSTVNPMLFDLLYRSDYAPARVKTRQRQKRSQREEFMKQAVAAAGVRGDWKSVVVTQGLAGKLARELENRQGEFKDDFSKLLEYLKDCETSEGDELRCGVTIMDLVRSLQNDDEKCLYIVVSHDPNNLRKFAHDLIDTVYEDRRRNGLITPLVSFIFDEADEFIRAEQAGDSEGYRDSRKAAHMLARRGRKFGLGLGISTQRIRYLDTSIMAQPHTYLVSKLPRKSDREAVAEAFGIPEEMFRQTFTFQAGNWLVMSHDAAGLRAVPIPVKTPNANERIAQFLTHNTPQQESKNEVSSQRPLL
jgi:hypothetical protein